MGPRLVKKRSGIEDYQLGREKSRPSAAVHNCVMACYKGVIPHLVPEMSDEQKAALMYGVKMPIVYSNVLIRQWTAFKNLGIWEATTPGMYHFGVHLGRAVQFGDYTPSKTPDEPMILHLTRVPCAPGRPKKEQHRLGQADLLAATFETFERNIRGACVIKCW